MIFGTRKTLLLLITLFSVLILFTRLDAGSLPSYDDAYYAQKAREILKTGELFDMRFNGIPRFDNPPGFMWLIAASFKTFGVSEFAARLPAAVAGVLGILGTFFLFELLIGAKVGFLAAIILNFTTVYLKYGRHAMMDTSVAASTVWCFYFFLRALRGWELGYLIAGLIGSYSFFAKSAFGGLAPAALFLYLLVTREWRPFRRPLFWLGTLVLILPYAAWTQIEYSRYGQVFINGHFKSLLLHSSANRGANDFWYDYVIVLLKYFPLFLPFMFLGIYQSFKARGRAMQQDHQFGLVFFFVFFVLLSLQGTKKTWYLIPALPACAGLAAIGLEKVLSKISLERMGRAFASAFLVAFFVLLATPVSLSKARAVDIRKISPFVRAASQQHFEILGYGIDDFGLNNALLFYSDAAARPTGRADLEKFLSDGKKIALVTSPSSWREIESGFPTLSVIRATEEWLILTNSPLDQTQVFN